MNIQSFLEHHGVIRNPFAEEDAQTDPVFKEHCIYSAYHPVWDKVYGDPAEPATAVVFGPKGSGKTAMRLQIDQHLARHNRQHPSRRVYVIRYDDFNPFLDHFSERMSRRVAKKPERVLEAWRLWDHMDAILCLGVTNLVDAVLAADSAATRSEATDRAVTEGQGTGGRPAPGEQTEGDAADGSQDDGATVHSQGDRATAHGRGGHVTGDGNDPWQRPDADWLDRRDLSRLDRTSARDLLLLACCYDQSTASTFTGRWTQLRRRLGYRNWLVQWDLALAILWAIAMLIVVWLLWRSDQIEPRNALWLLPLLVVVGFLPYGWRWLRCQRLAMGVRRHMRVGKRETGSMRKVLLRMPPKELASQPLPRYDRTDDRYELLQKFQSLIGRLGFTGTIVLVDRVDEPHLTGGRTDMMRRFVWPLLDNKLLKHPGLGLKLMLPQELHRDVEREGREFHERARLDKQNVIPAFAWTGESLFDLARARMIACATDGHQPDPRDLFDEKVSYPRLLAAFQSLRVPRHLFRFLYRVLVEHCNHYTDAEPRYRVDAETFEAVLAVYARELESPS